MKPVLRAVCRVLFRAALASFCSDCALNIHVLKSTVQLKKHLFTVKYGILEVGQWPSEVFIGEKTARPRTCIKINQIDIYHCCLNSVVWFYHTCCSSFQCLNLSQK